MSNDLQTIRHRHRTASLNVFGLDVIGLLGLLYCTTVVVTKFRRIFDEFMGGQPLPALTSLVLSIPRPVCAVFLVAALVALIYKEVRITNKTHTLLLNLATLVVIVFLLAVFVDAMFTPLIVDIDRLRN